MTIDRDIPGLNAAKTRAAGIARGIRKRTDLTALTSRVEVDTQSALTVARKNQSAWVPAHGTHPARWTLPSGFPDYWHNPTPPKE
jgi:hypothetical protein